MVSERDATLGMLGAAALISLLVFSVGPSLGIIGGFMLILAALLATVAFIVFKWGYWMIPYFRQGKRTIQGNDAEIDIPLSDDVIVREEGGVFYATMFANIKLFKSATAMTENEKMSFMSLWERAVSGLKTVTKYGMLLYLKDLSHYKESIEDRKAKAQMAISKESEGATPNANRVLALEREVAMWDNISSRLGVGDKPTAIVTFVQTSAKGATKDGAIAAVRQNINEIKSTVGTALNVEVAVLAGDDMRRCFDWEYAMPPATKEL